MIRRLTISLLAAGAFVLLVAPAASAHDELVASIPANSYTMNQLPAAAKLTFGEDSRAEDLTVRASGRRLAVAAVPGDPHSLTVDLDGVRPTETVSLTWRMVDEHDGHVTSGVLSFHLLEHVSDRAPAAGGPADRPDRPLHALSLTTHVIGYAAMAVVLGGLFFVSVLWPAGASDGRTRKLLAGATAAGLASAVTAVYVATAQVAPMSFRDAVAQHFGRVAVAVALLWLLVSVLVVGVLQQPDAVRRTAWRVGAVVVGGGLVRAIGMSAHDTQGRHATTGLVVDFLHLTAVSAWVGGLAVMAVGLLPRGQLRELAVVVPRFSRVAATSVLLLVVSGVILAWQLIGSVSGVFTTHYGHVLLVKLTLVGCVLLAAQASRLWVHRHLTVPADDQRAVGSFVASVSAESVLVLAVLVAASVLVTSSPGL